MNCFNKYLLYIFFHFQLASSSTTITFEESYTTAELVLPTTIYLSDIFGIASNVTFSDDSYARSVVSYAEGMFNYMVTATGEVISYEAGLSSTALTFLGDVNVVMYVLDIASYDGSSNGDYSSADSSNDDGTEDGSDNTGSDYGSASVSNSLTTPYNGVESTTSASTTSSSFFTTSTLNPKTAHESSSTSKNETIKTFSKSTSQAGSHGKVGSDLGMIISFVCAVIFIFH